MPDALRNQPDASAMSDWLLLLVPGIIWGASFLFIAEGLEATGPMGVTLVRIAIGFAALACFPSIWTLIPPTGFRASLTCWVWWTPRPAPTAAI